MIKIIWSFICGVATILPFEYAITRIKVKSECSKIRSIPRRQYSTCREGPDLQAESKPLFIVTITEHKLSMSGKAFQGFYIDVPPGIGGLSRQKSSDGYVTYAGKILKTVSLFENVFLPPFSDY